jgi:tetratricopeptide (TPR) repeat protein
MAARKGKPEIPKSNVLAQSRKRKGDDAAVAGRLDEARELFESACRADSRDVEAWVKLAMVHKRLGNYAAAESCARRAVELKSDLGFCHYALGTALHCQGRTPQAIDCYRLAIRLQPGFPDAHYLLGNALHEVGKVTEAIESYQQAIRLRPDFPEALGDLGSALLALGETESARPLLEQTLKRQPGNSVALVNYCNLLRLEGNVDEAIKTFRHALDILPNSTPVVSGLAGMLEKIGRIEEAQQLVEQGLALTAEDPGLNLVAAQLERRGSRLDAAASRLEGLRKQRLPIDLDGDVRLLLGQIYDELGQTNQAYPLIAEGKRLKARLAFRDETGSRSYLDRVALISSFATSSLARTSPVPTARPVIEDPVFLIGFPRSGTTLLEQILESHPSIQTLEEKGTVAAMVNRFLEHARDGEESLAALSADVLQELRETYFSQVQRHITIRQDTILVDKMPLNTVGVPVIWRVFPNAKFILAVRHPCDVCLSCLMQNFSANQGMAGFYSLDDTVETYVAVMSAWRKYVELLPLKYHRIRYEDLIADVPRETRALLDFLGVEWNDSVLDHISHARQKGTINTPSYHQVTRPIYQSAKYRWMRYRDVFNPYLPRLQSYIDYFDYEQADIQ